MFLQYRSPGLLILVPQWDCGWQFLHDESAPDFSGAAIRRDTIDLAAILAIIGAISGRI